MTMRPSWLVIGCRPVGVRSIMASRRWPSAIPAAGSLQWPSPSGPRYAIASVMARDCAASASAGAPAKRQMPVIPHIGPRPRSFVGAEAIAQHLVDLDRAGAPGMRRAHQRGAALSHLARLARIGDKPRDGACQGGGVAARNDQAAAPRGDEVRLAGQ